MDELGHILEYVIPILSGIAHCFLSSFDLLRLCYL